MKKNTVYCGINDVVMNYIKGMVDKYGWPIRWFGTLEDMYSGTVDFEAHTKVSHHATFLLGLTPMAMAQFGSWAIYSKPNYNLVYVSDAREGGIEEVVIRKWLAANGFPLAKTLFFGNTDRRLDFLLQNAKYLDIVIDSRKEILEPIYKRAAPVTVVMDAPWNRGLTSHRRVVGWAELSTWFVNNKIEEIMGEPRP